MMGDGIYSANTAREFPSHWERRSGRAFDLYCAIPRLAWHAHPILASTEMMSLLIETFGSDHAEQKSISFAEENEEKGHGRKNAQYSDEVFRLFAQVVSSNHFFNIGEAH